MKVWSTDTKIVIGEFGSITEAGKHFKTDKRNISRWIIKKTKFYSEIYKANITLR